MLPPAKMVTEARRAGLRPKIWDRDAIGGWTTVEARRKLVPRQKASIAEAPMSSTMVFGLC